MHRPQLHPVIDRVLTYGLAMPVERDHWEKAPLVSAALLYGTPVQVATVQRWMDRSIETQTSNGSLNYSDRQVYGEGHVKILNSTPTLSTVLAYRLLDFHDRTHEPRYLEACERMIAGLAATPRCGNGGFWNAYEGAELHIDIVYMVSPFLIRYGVTTGKTEWIEEGVRQIDAHVDVLYHARKNLCRHTWKETPDCFPQSQFWSRGNAWLFCALLESLEWLPRDHAAHTRLAELLDANLHGTAAYQDRSGYFRNILDDPLGKLETSGTLMFAYATARGHALGLCNADLLPAARRAFDVTLGGITEAGAVTGVAVPPGGPSIPFGSTPFGQGFFLLAAHALGGR